MTSADHQNDLTVQPSPILIALRCLTVGQDLTCEQTTEAIRQLVSGEFDEPEASNFLLELKKKGETALEISAAATVLRERMVRLTRTSTPILDTCGTGGDESGTFNISTAVALVVAAAGCTVVKHGNRSVSSRSGSADVLSELGVPIEKGPAWAQKCLDELGFAFCFAPHFHPVLSTLGALRRSLGVRTIFNLLGPLLNPASAEYHLLGVGRKEMLEPLAGAASLLGIEKAFLVSSEDGLDEVSLGAPTHVRLVRGKHIESVVWTSKDFDLAPCGLEEMKASGPAESARVIKGVLQGDRGPCQRIVLANAAAALLAAEKVDSLVEGTNRARATLDAGLAYRLLEQLRMS